MLWSLGGFKSSVKPKRLCSETLVFFLHYRVTAILLLFSCILISADTFAGDKIKCLFRLKHIYNKDFLDNYCWATSTYSIASSQNDARGPHPGVEGRTAQEQHEYRNFYQYVHIVLFIQAVLFYVPHMVWKKLEPKFLYFMEGELQKTVFDEKEKAEATVNKFAIFIEERWGSYNFIAFKYILCELLALFNIAMQAYFLDVFFHGKFINLGLFFSTYYNSEIFSDPTRLFPLVTICSFQRYGSTGHIDPVDALCVLPINAINGKIFLCMWIWFAILFPLTLANLIYLVLSYTCSHFRAFFPKVNGKIKGYVTRSPVDDSYTKLVTLGDAGDWFVLSSLKNNVDERTFGNLSESILSKLPSLEIEDEES